MSIFSILDWESSGLQPLCFAALWLPGSCLHFYPGSLPNSAWGQHASIVLCTSTSKPDINKCCIKLALKLRWCPGVLACILLIGSLPAKQNIERFNRVYWHHCTVTCADTIETEEHYHILYSCIMNIYELLSACMITYDYIGVFLQFLIPLQLELHKTIDCVTSFCPQKTCTFRVASPFSTEEGSWLGWQRLESQLDPCSRAGTSTKPRSLPSAWRRFGSCLALEN